MVLPNVISKYYMLHSLATSQLQTWLEIATEAALAAGEIINKYRGNLAQIDQKGRLGDLVTVADREAETTIIEILQRHLPTHSILAEETGKYESSDAEYLWVIDPLDGTTNYAHQYPFSVVSIGLLINGLPTLGVIFDPFHQELFRAATGLGATRNRQPLQVSATNQLADSLLVTGFAYDRRETTDHNYREFCYLTHITQGVRRSGSAAIDLAYVACGRLDGYWERGLSPWDLAAGVVIVREAGGLVTAYDQSDFLLNSGRILATNGKIHRALSQSLAKVQQTTWSFPAELFDITA
jgi:myo-inositol-1(or 4)-monophosphatase